MLYIQLNSFETWSKLVVNQLTKKESAIVINVLFSENISCDFYVQLLVRQTIC